MIELAEIVILGALVAAAAHDIKTREVPDWVSHGLIFTGVGIALIKSLVFMDFTFLLYSALGLGFFVALAYLMFYTGQWGGGDSKIMMGIGALLGLQVSLNFPYVDPSQRLIAFLANMIVIALFYGLAYSAGLAFKHRKEFRKSFRKQMDKLKITRYITLVLAIAFLSAIFFISDLFIKITTAAFVVITIFTLYLWIFVKAVENSSMYKQIKPEKLVEGDWIAKDIKMGKKLICSKKSLGINKEQIAQLIKLKKQKKLSTVLVKEGIPFVPSFLISFIVTLIWGNLLFYFL